MSGILDPGPMSPPLHAPGVKIEREVDLTTRVTAFQLSATVDHRFTVVQEVLMRPDAEQYVLGLLERSLSTLQQDAIRALGLEAWRDEHERELEAKAERERLELVRSLYSAVRAAPTLAAAQLLLADELEAHR